MAGETDGVALAGGRAETVGERGGEWLGKESAIGDAFISGCCSCVCEPETRCEKYDVC